MDYFNYSEGVLRAEDADVRALAEQFGTPAYIYSQQTIVDHFERIQTAFAELNPLVCFAVKSCPNIHVCRLLAERGCGFDVVSGGELFRALQAGADPSRIVFAGVGKTEKELLEGIDAGIAMFNVESASEAQQLARLAAQRGVKVRAALRVNPDVDAGTHAYTTTGTRETKFGVAFDRAEALFRECAKQESLQLRGLHVHIGSPVNDVSRFRKGVEQVLGLVDRLRDAGFEIDSLDIGGGFGAFYEGTEAPPASAYAEQIVPLLKPRGLKIEIEPGRSIVANAGILITRVLHIKGDGPKRFVVVDASMNELIRPALYGAYHFVWPVNAGSHLPDSRKREQPFDDLHVCDVVGPVCESGDFLAKDRALPDVAPGDLLAVFSAGAYAMSMASQYNSRPRAPEVLVSGAAGRLIRRRETYDDLIAAEREVAS